MKSIFDTEFEPATPHQYSDAICKLIENHSDRCHKRVYRSEYFERMSPTIPTKESLLGTMDEYIADRNTELTELLARFLMTYAIVQGPLGIFTHVPFKSDEFTRHLDGGSCGRGGLVLPQVVEHFREHRGTPTIRQTLQCIADIPAITLKTRNRISAYLTQANK